MMAAAAAPACHKSRSRRPFAAAGAAALRCWPRKYVRIYMLLPSAWRAVADVPCCAAGPGQASRCVMVWRARCRQGEAPAPARSSVIHHVHRYPFHVLLVW